MHRRPTLQYGLREANSFSQCVEKLGGYQRVDEAITGLIEALRINPEIYHVVRGMKDIRLCKTDRVGDCPEIRWWFRIDQASKAIELLHAEAVGEDYGEG